MWNNLEVTGEGDWLAESIRDSSCHTVTDGSYIQDKYLDMVNCQGFDFNCIFSHVKAHQDDTIPFHQLDRPSLLNCMMDEMAKWAICSLHPGCLPKLCPSPLEPLVASVGGSKPTTDSGPCIRYWAHKQLGSSPHLHQMGHLGPAGFRQGELGTILHGNAPGTMPFPSMGMQADPH